MNQYQIRNADFHSNLPLVIIATVTPTPTFPGTNPRWSGTKLLLQFSSVFKSSSPTVAGGCDVNGGEIAGYFPSPRASKCHAYSWIPNVTGTMTRHTMCVQGRYGHSFDLSQSNVSFRARIIRRRKNSTLLINRNHKKISDFRCSESVPCDLQSYDTVQSSLQMGPIGSSETMEQYL